MWRCSGDGGFGPLRLGSLRRCELTARGRGLVAVLGIVGLVLLAEPLFGLAQVLVAMALPLVAVVIISRGLRQRVRGAWWSQRHSQGRSGDGRP